MARGQVTLAGTTPLGERILLRPLRLRDQKAYLEVRRRDREWLLPWDPTNPDGDSPVVTYREMVRKQRARTRALESLAFLIVRGDEIIGQVNGNTITWGSARSFSAGYWVTSRAAGQWVAPTAVALLGDYGFGALGLHRLELGIRPENVASISVARKLRMREEGVRTNYLHIDGAWRDHLIFAMTVEDLADGWGATFRERVERSFAQRAEG